MGKKISEITAEESSALSTGDLFEGEESGGTSFKVAWSVVRLSAANFIASILPDGLMLNGKISATVSSNNLTVAIKTAAGSDPSSTDPVYVKINGTLRTISAALSVTINAGASTFNAGSSELASKEIDYFVYLGYNATDGVVIGVSRICHAITYGDFNTTSTNEKYAAISDISNAASTDDYVVVGRFNATNSGSASYNWSIPATSIVIQRPIYTTRWLSWQPTYTGSGSMTYTSVTTSQAIYKFELDKCFVSMDINGTTGGTASYGIQSTPPMKINTTKMPGIPYLPCYVINPGPTKPGGYLRYAQAAFDGVQAELLSETAWALGAGAYFRGSLIYAI